MTSERREATPNVYVVTVETMSQLHIVDLSTHSPTSSNVAGVGPGLDEFIVWTYGAFVLGDTSRSDFDPIQARAHFAKPIQLLKEIDRVRATQNRSTLFSTDAPTDTQRFASFTPVGAIAIPGSQSLLVRLLSEDPDAAVAFGSSVILGGESAESTTFDEFLSVWRAKNDGLVPESPLTAERLKTILGHSIVIFRPEAFADNARDTDNHAVNANWLLDNIIRAIQGGWRLLKADGACTVARAIVSDVGLIVHATNPVGAPGLGPGVIRNDRHNVAAKSVDLDVSKLWMPQLQPDSDARRLEIQPYFDGFTLPALTVDVGSSICVPELEHSVATRTLHTAKSDKTRTIPKFRVTIRATGPLGPQRHGEWKRELQRAFDATSVRWDLAEIQSNLEAGDEAAEVVLLLAPSALPTAEWFRGLICEFVETSTNVVICTATPKTTSTEAGHLHSFVLNTLARRAERTNSGRDQSGVLALRTFSVTNLTYRTSAFANRDPLESVQATQGSGRLLVEEQRTFGQVRRSLRLAGRTLAKICRRQPSVLPHLASITKELLWSSKQRHDWSAFALLATLVPEKGSGHSITTKRPSQSGIKRVFVVGPRYEHHSFVSGYERNFEAFSKRLRTPRFRWKSGGRWNQFEKLLRVVSDNPTYSTGALFAEVVGALSMLRNPKVLHHQIYGETDGWLLPMLGRFRPFSATLHMPPSRFQELGVEVDRFRFAKLLIVVDPSLLSFVQTRLPETSVRLIEIGVDYNFFAIPGPHPVTPNRRNPKPFVLCVGSHLRDFDTLFRSWANAKPSMTQPFELHVVGAPTEVIKHVESLRLADVVFRGRLSDEELRNAYQTCDALVLPLTDATANTTLLEAQACGSPIYTTDAVGTRHYLGADASYLPPHDVAAWTASFVALSKRPARKQQAFDQRRWSQKVISDRIQATFANL